MDTLTQFALGILTQATDIPKTSFRMPLEITSKLDDSPATIVDQNAEKLIRDALKQEYPGHAITGEEFGSSEGEGKVRWIIDPIDGTKSYITGFPLYGMLLGLLEDEKPVFGAIHMPELGDTYIGEGGRTTINGDELLITSQVSSLAEAKVYINEGEKIFGDDPELFAHLCKMGAIRRLSYDCFPHAMLAAGYIDICIDYDLKPYDFLPLVPIVEGAGGIITDWEGKPLSMTSGGRVVSAANPELHQELISELSR